MKLLYGILLLSTALLTSCAQRLPDPGPTAVDQPEHRFAEKIIQTIYQPAIGEMTQKNVGETIIEEKIAESIDAIVLTAPLVFAHLNPPRQFAAGTKFLHISDTPTTRIYCASRCLEQKNGVVSATGEPNIAIPPSMFSIENVVTDVVENSLQRNLVYTGRSGKTIFLSYREFINNIARPAFTQELTFDISTDRVVGFRGARIEVMNVTNATINYRILNGFQETDGVTRAVKRRNGKAVQDIRSVPEGKYVVCKRVNGHVETLGEAECAAVGIAL